MTPSTAAATDGTPLAPGTATRLGHSAAPTSTGPAWTRSAPLLRTSRFSLCWASVYSTGSLVTAISTMVDFQLVPPASSCQACTNLPSVVLAAMTSRPSAAVATLGTPVTPLAATTVLNTGDPIMGLLPAVS